MGAGLFEQFYSYSRFMSAMALALALSNVETLCQCLKIYVYCN